MAEPRMSRKAPVGIALAVVAVGAAFFSMCTRPSAKPSRFDTAPPLASLPHARLPFEPPEELLYEFGWSGIPAATLRFTTRWDNETPGAGLVVEYEARSVPTIEALWQLEATGRTLLDAATLRPLSGVSRKRSRDREKIAESRFDWSAGAVEVTIRKTRKGRASEKVVSLEAGLDIPSAFLALRAARGGQSVRVLNGDDAYQVVVTDRGTAPLKLPDGTVEAVRCEVAVRELNAEEDEPTASQPKSTTAQVWMDPRSRAPLRLEAQVLVGRVYAELISAGAPRAAGGP